MQFVPDTKPKSTEIAVRISGTIYRVLTCDKCIAKEHKKKKKQQDEEKERK